MLLLADQPPAAIAPAALGTFVIACVALVGLVVALGARTALLRDTDPAIADFRLRPFSLAKSQLAFWTVVVIGTYLYIYIVNPDVVSALNSTALELLGISMGTSALAAATGPASPPPAKSPTPFVPRPVPPVPIQNHANYVDDILSDNQGMSIHRLQMALWTLVFGGIFIFECYKNRKFPDFNPETFVLMGISSGTYVWFRRTES